MNTAQAANGAHAVDGLPPYFAVVVRRAMLVEARRALALVRLPVQHLPEASAYAKRVPLEPEHVVSFDGPFEALDRRDCALALRTMLEEAGAYDDQVIARLFGLDGAEPEAPGALAARLGIPAQAVYDTRYRWLSRARDNARLRQLWEDLN